MRFFIFCRYAHFCKMKPRRFGPYGAKESEKKLLEGLDDNIIFSYKDLITSKNVKWY